jgi:hypothetical protein
MTGRRTWLDSLGVRLIGLAWCVASVCSAFPVTAPRTVDHWFVDSLIKVFPEDKADKHALAVPQVAAARNSHASIQFVVRASRRVDNVTVAAKWLGRNAAGLGEIQVRPVGYVPAAANTPDTPSSELIHSVPALFPDVLFERFPITLEPGKTQPLWLTLRIGAGCVPGRYRAEVVVREKGIQRAREAFSVEVLAASVPSRQTLKVTNWFYLSDRWLVPFFGVKSRTEEWWKLIENMARVMAEHRQNVIVTPLTGFYFSRLALIQARPRGDGLEYDFTDFDRWVNTFQRAGVIGYIEGSHVLRREEDLEDPNLLRVDVYLRENGKAVLRSLPPDDPRVEGALTQMFSALYAHLKEKGWAGIYYQHIMDEPEGSGGNLIPVYRKFAELVRRTMPDVLTIDAISAPHDYGVYEKSCDIWVPVLGSFEGNGRQIREHARNGREVWFYTCLAPTGRYPNRFLDYSLVKVRMLHWIDFRYGLTGFLHWGGNYWSSDPFHETQPVVMGGSSWVTLMLPPGDAFISYPEPQGKTILSSIRWEMMTEGIEDYELLQALKEKDSDAAQKLALQVVRSSTDYVRDPGEFRKLRMELLKALSASQ